MQRDLARLTEQMKQLFPSENDRRSRPTARTSCCPAASRSKDIIEKAVNVAAGYVDKKEEVVTLLQLGQGAAEQPGAAARAVRRSEPQRDDRARRRRFHRQRRQERPLRFGRSDRRSSSRRRQWDRATASFVFSDFLNLFLFDTKEQLGGGDQGAADQGPVPEPRRAEPRRRERQGSQLPRRRRVPDSRSPRARGANIGDQRHVQGIRHPPELHADRQRRPRPPQGQARSQHARLQQRASSLQRLPDPGAHDAPDRDRARAERTARRSPSPG